MSKLCNIDIKFGSLLVDEIQKGKALIDMLDNEYLMVLQLFAYALNMPNNKKRAEQFYNEVNKDVLLAEIGEHKRIINEKKFYYLAGQTIEHILSDEDNQDDETINRLCGAIKIFERAIELEV